MQEPGPATNSLSVPHAWRLLQLRRPELALRMADQLLARNPASPSALVIRSEALRWLKRLSEAVDAARQAVALAPHAAGTFAALARAYGQQGELYEAELAIREALRLTPTEAAYYAFLAELHYLLRRPAEAIATAQDGLALNAQQADCLLWLALAQEALSHPEAADEAFSRLLYVAPTSDLAHAKLGQVLLQRYEPAAANRHLSAALRQAPGRAAELLPLLRQARRQQHWPAWFLRSEQRARTLRALGTAPGLGVFVNRLRASWAVARARWLTRHDPLFQLSRREVWQRRLKAWLLSVLLVPVLILGGNYFELIGADTPLSLPQMLGLVLGGGLFLLVAQLMKRKIDSPESNL
ncbi:MAG: hypothetical protein EOO59_01245 [Hymenobacter sp.]|nr:MAG: hypothetical protein EOO59_01245 [Hymenobacter sp.]